ncbi:hypothetical protein LCGC14_1368300 [marine sediment metagenome]|uniref:Uncharacterized protein n=1 Tax=marine sediment metagenome TaxID=412755 RepID=A0A0F9K633_9ZZZZ
MKNRLLTDVEIAILWTEFHNRCEVALFPDSPDFRNTYRAKSIKQWPGSAEDCYFASMVAKAQDVKTASILSKGTNATDYLKGYTDAEKKYQQRMEGIKRKIEEKFQLYLGDEWEGRISDETRWEDFWKKEGIDG